MSEKERMINVQQLLQNKSAEAFSDFCEKLANNDRLGIGLHPHNLGARGGATFPGQDIKDIEGKDFDRVQVGKFLEILEDGTEEFPKIAEKYCEVLNKAKGIWEGLEK